MQKWGTLVKIGHTWENGSDLEKWITLGKMNQSSKNGSHFEKIDHFAIASNCLMYKNVLRPLTGTVYFTFLYQPNQRKLNHAIGIKRFRTRLESAIQ